MRLLGLLAAVLILVGCSGMGPWGSFSTSDDAECSINSVPLCIRIEGTGNEPNKTDTKARN
jgi:hypothetical protein